MSFHVAKTGKMSKVTLAVFCTLLGLLPLCRAYIKRKEANAKFDDSRSEFRLFDVLA